tara:strand:- start:2245 stop:2382 length:138 start_codon:yes stop_codon:yes gene_type:complete
MNSDTYWSMMHRLNQGKINAKQMRKQMLTTYPPTTLRKLQIGEEE